MSSRTACLSPAGFFLCSPLLLLCYIHHPCQQAQPSSKPSLVRINLGKKNKAKAQPKQGARAKYIHIKSQLSSLLYYIRELFLLKTLESRHPSSSNPKTLQVSREIPKAQYFLLQSHCFITNQAVSPSRPALSTDTKKYTWSRAPLSLNHRDGVAVCGQQEWGKVGTEACYLWKTQEETKELETLQLFSHILQQLQNGLQVTQAVSKNTLQHTGKLCSSQYDLWSTSLMTFPKPRGRERFPWCQKLSSRQTFTGDPGCVSVCQDY